MEAWAKFLNEHVNQIAVPALAVSGTVFYLLARFPRLWIVRAAAVSLGVAMVLISVALMAMTLVLLGPGKPVLDRIFEDVFIMATSVLIFGFGLFVLRQRDRTLYGLVEIFSAVATASYVAWSPSGGPIANLLAFLAATYIVVRGLDNVQVGFSADAPTAVRFREWRAARASRKTRNNPGEAPVRPEETATKQEDDRLGPAAS